MPSWVELCFLDMVFAPVGVKTDLAEIHVFGIPGYRKRRGQAVISPSVQNFLRTFVVNILFRQSALISNFPFHRMQLWLYDSTVPEGMRPYKIPALAADALTLATEIDAARLRVIHVLKDCEANIDARRWENVVEMLMRVLFAEFIEMPGVPLYFIKNPTIENERRPVSTVDVSPAVAHRLLFDSIIVRIL